MRYRSSAQAGYLLLVAGPGARRRALGAHGQRGAPNIILLLEDIDATFVGRESQRRRRGGCTFSGLLNALDGVKTKEGRVLFITTNHPERLDPALTRPGRCDVSVFLDQASDSQMERAYLRFYDGAAAAAEGGQIAA